MNGSTRFNAMGAPQVSAWVAWANSHDWGANRSAWYDTATGEVVTYGGEYDKGNAYSVVEARHDTPRAMREWAGY